MTSLLHYTIEGTGHPVVFIHGFCENAEIWADFKPYFTKNYQVICIDLPGHGKSAGTGEGTTIEKMAELVHKTLASCGIEKPVMIGHSLGGYVTLAYADLFPEYLSGFLLFHSSVYEDNAEKKESRNKTAEYVKNHGVDAFSNPFVPGLFYIKRRKELNKSIEYATAIARKMTVDNIVNTIIAMRDREERVTTLEQTEIPVGFIVGKDDTAVPFEKSLSQCHLPKQSTVLFLAETGHMGMFEREKECVQFVNGFLFQVYGITGA